MFQLNLHAFGSGSNKHALFIILDNFCNLIDQIYSSIETNSDDFEESVDIDAENKHTLLLKSGVKCDHCRWCKLCVNWLCSDCLQMSGFENSEFYCIYYKHVFSTSCV